MLQSEPEVREFPKNLRIVTDGSPDVSRILQEQCPVEECHQIVGFEVEHEVEVKDGLVVVAHLCPQQSSVVMSQEVVGVKVERRVIVGHRTAQIVKVETSNGTVHIAVHPFGHQVDGLAQIVVTLLPLLPCHTDDGFLTPQGSIIGIQCNAFIKRC